MLLMSSESHDDEEVVVKSFVFFLLHSLLERLRVRGGRAEGEGVRQMKNASGVTAVEKVISGGTWMQFDAVTLR